MNKAWILLFLLLAPFTDQQCCTKKVANSNKCAECPSGTHLFRGSCIIDVNNCVTYADGFDCSACKTGFNLKNGQCQAVSGGGTVSPPTPPANGVQQTYLDIESNDNLFILLDYSRSFQKDLETADALFGIIRKYPNGTQHTVIQYQTKDKKYYESIAEFDKVIPFVFKLITIKPLPAKPVKPNDSNTGGSTGENTGGNTGGNTNPPNNNNSTGQGNATNNSSGNSSSNTSSTIISSITQRLFGVSQLGYKVLSYEQRKKDRGFQVIDPAIRASNKNTLGDNPVVLAAFYQTKGLNAQYLIYYESTDKKSIYELKSIYQALRNRATTLSLTRTSLR